MRTRATLLPIALLLFAAAAHAQQVTVGATLPVASPTGGGARDLTFGVITPISGTTQNIDVIAAAAPVSASVQSGEFRFNVSGSRGVAFNITVPAQLSAPGATPLAVSFNGAQFGGHCIVAGGSACTLTSFNPTAGTVTACAQLLGNGNCHQNRVYQPGSEMRVYVGGRVTVPPAARPAVYNGTVTMTIVQVY